MGNFNGGILSLCVIFLKILIASCFYMPDGAPVNYCRESKPTSGCQNRVMFYANNLNSEETAVPYEYSHFDFCPADGSESLIEHLLQVIFAEGVRLPYYNVSFLKDVHCALACRKKYDFNNSDDVKKIDNLKAGILKNYQQYWTVDNMPVTFCYAVGGDEPVCSAGFPIGCYVDVAHQPKDLCIMNKNFSESDTYYVFNHLDIIINYESEEEETRGTSLKTKAGRILRIKIQPRSLKNQVENRCSRDLSPMDIPNKLKTKSLTISYTYSVTFVKDNVVTWSSRWDYILHFTPYKNTLWFSIFSSLVVMTILTGMVFRILFRISNDYYADRNEIESKPFRWKLLCGDVFRLPRKPMLLSVFLGSGMQIFLMALITLFLGSFDLLYHANRGPVIAKSMMVIYVCLGIPAGYITARMYKALGGIKYKFNVMLVSAVFPGSVFLLFFIIHAIFWINDNGSATPFTELLALLSLWFGIAPSFNFIGAYFGYKTKCIEFSAKTNHIPRQIPKQSIYTRSVISFLVGGIFPFACVFMQFYFILNYIWSGQVYYDFSIMFAAFTILVFTCYALDILLCYYHLCAEDYHWWWRSFLSTGFSAVYLFIYCVYYFVTKLQFTDALSIFLYFSCTITMVFLFFLVTGTMGFFACFWFVMDIYIDVPENQNRRQVLNQN